MSYLKSDNITLNIIILSHETVLKRLVIDTQANQNSSKLSCDCYLSGFLIECTPFTFAKHISLYQLHCTVEYRIVQIHKIYIGI